MDMEAGADVWLGVLLGILNGGKSSSSLWEMSGKAGEDFLKEVITGGETWVRS